MTNKPVSQLDWNSHAHGHILDNKNPIIEEPASPELEPETAEIKEDAIEDASLMTLKKSLLSSLILRNLHRT
jgi:hypothetical protein